MQELVGQTLGQYQVIAQIGKGGMSTVYQATQGSMKRSVAIKVLPPNLMHDDKFVSRFYREVQIAASLQHPHILPVFDFGEHDSLLYIVMAYVDGGTLSDVILQGQMTSNDILRYTDQMAAALDYAHRKGVIHRDFKPANVLLDGHGNTYLTDFGLAKMSDSSQLTGTGILGTPSYMAPEQSEPGDLTIAADIYALGATVFQMLTGRVPFEAPTPLGVLMAHMTHPVPNILQLRPELSEAVQLVIDRAMAKSPALRHASAGEFTRDLQAALGNQQPITQTSEVPQSGALLMTNTLGQIIFADQSCLKLLRRHQSDARAIMGKALHEVFGLERKLTEQWMQRISQSGQLATQEVTIKDAKGTDVSVMCSAIATRDDKGVLVGADFTLRALQKREPSKSDSQGSVTRIDTTDETFIQNYFVKQMNALRAALIQWGGKRLGSNLDNIINDTAQRNVWPVTIHEGQVQIDQQMHDLDAYRALLAKAIAYAVNLVGKKIVIKAMQAADSQLDGRILQVVSSLRVYDLFEVL